MSTEAWWLAVATIDTDSEISRTVKATLVLVVSSAVATTNAARSAPAATKASGSSSAPSMTR